MHFMVASIDDIGRFLLFLDRSVRGYAAHGGLYLLIPAGILALGLVFWLWRRRP